MKLTKGLTKVYELVGSRWTDRGTAFCSGEFDEPAEEAKLIARSEASSEVLLNATIRASDVYQRQQDTLIVWTEPDGTDFALSFQDVEGCAEVWDFIVEVQRHLNANRGTRWSSDDFDVSTSDQSDELFSSSPIVSGSGPRPFTSIHTDLYDLLMICTIFFQQSTPQLPSSTLDIYLNPNLIRHTLARLKKPFARWRGHRSRESRCVHTYRKISISISLSRHLTRPKRRRIWMYYMLCVAACKRFVS